MIINAVKATNVLKYAELDLQDLPEKGIIAISGENESGKSTIGETVCFALFGRTFSLGPDDLDKVLRWGEHHCAVTLDFTVDGVAYQLSRFLDRDGSHSARLSKADDIDNPIARGVSGVADRLFEILGYEFDEFVESFYLAQREITTPHPHSVAVKTMAGVAPLEYVAAGFEDEIAQFDEMTEELEAEAEALNQELEELDFQEGYLMQLEDGKNELEAEINANKSVVENLEAAADVYVQNQPLLKRALGKRGRARFWRFISFVLALIAGGAWFLLAKKPDMAQSQQLLQMLQQKLPNWQDAWIPYIGYAGIGFAVLMLLFWIRSAQHASRARTLADDSRVFSDALEKARAVTPFVGETASEKEEAASKPEPEFSEAGEEQMTIPAVDEPVRPEESAFAALLSKVDDVVADIAEVRTYVEAESHWLRSQINSKEEKFWALGQEVDRELERVRQVARLTEVTESLQQKIMEIQGKKEKRLKAIELLEGASGFVSSNFNRDIRDLVARTLPVFTQGRYEHLRIDPDLTVRVFSSDKRDFMDLDEVSSGTQRQIMLALRLALSEKLLTRRVHGDQFAFLDEPFAFFDEDRTRYALKALTGMSDKLSQIWIVAQVYPEGTDVEFALSLKCSRDLDRLSA
ncbi:MAG TPA: ATPase [Thiolapillus brandeum]|uniref:ATPase n=1 Tax=Thiolapillus brandeum TaxID=1076588 RepID=A0A831WC10_9GAMM|nr:ATPase [Thiolapillus brandeum]